MQTIGSHIRQIWQQTSLQSDPYHVGHGLQALARRYLQRLLSANPKGSHALLIAHPPILLCSFALHGSACYSDSEDWFLTLVLTRLSRFACEIGPICVCRAAQHVIRLHSMTSAFLHLPTGAGAGAGTPDKIRQHSVAPVGWT